VTLRADDRVLLLDIPADKELAGIARILSHGVLVALGTAEAVDRARAALAEFDNVMFIEANPERIPWRDQFFTVVLVAQHMASAARAAAGEIARVLAPGGRIVSDSVEA
jgi:SAM-dependent methyltransferase